MEFTSELFSILFRFESDGRRGKKKSYGSGMEDFGILIPCLLLLFFVWGEAKKQKQTKSEQLEAQPNSERSGRSMLKTYDAHQTWNKRAETKQTRAFLRLDAIQAIAKRYDGENNKTTSPHKRKKNRPCQNIF